MSEEKPVITVEDAHKWVESAKKHIDKSSIRQAEYNRCIEKMERTEIENAKIMADNHRRLAAQDARIVRGNRITYLTWAVEFSMLAYIIWRVTP